MKAKGPKFQPPTSNEKPICYVNGSPLYKRVVKGRTFQWCSKCTPPCWSTTHNTGTHSGKVSPRNNSDAQAHFGLVIYPSIWIAKTFAPLDNSDFDKPLEYFKITMTLEKPKAKPEPMKSIPNKPSLPNKNCFNHYGLLIMCLMASLFNPLIFNWLSSAVIKNYTILRALSIGEIIDMTVLLPAPLLWIFLAYTIVYGKKFYSLSTRT